MSLTTAQLQILWHTLGLKPERRESYRNYFVASEGHHDIAVLRELEGMGLMEVARSPAFLDKDAITFVVTGVGKALALDHLPMPPPLTRYRQYLREDGSQSFGDHLCKGRLPKYEQRGNTWDRTREYRMYRKTWDEYDRSYYRDVQGEWMPTKKAAKATYKTALKAHQKTQRELAHGHN